MDFIRGVVEYVTYENEDTGYSVIKIRAQGYNDLIPVIGNMASVNVGSVLSIRGEWVNNPKYGRQFNSVNWEDSLPASVFGIQKYLGSGLIKGIGPQYAKKIVDLFKENTLKVIEESPDELIEVDGIGKKRVDMIKKAWMEQKEIKNIMLFLQEYGVSTAFGGRIYKTYQDNSINIIKENPYRLADDIYGIGFKTADGIAQKLGIDKESYMRCRSGVFYVLNKLAENGHCYATMEELTKKAEKILDIEEPKIVMTVDYLSKQNELINEKDMFYLPPFFYSESGTTKRLMKIFQTDVPKHNDYMEIIEKTIANSKIRYDEIQIQAIKKAAESKILILTGGPGTGKTTTMLAFVNIFRALGLKILLAAPTGRAAKRLSESTGMEAKTIHRLLDYKPPEGYKRNEHNLLQGDVLIVDESSMIDIILMYNLLKAVPNSMILIFVGDIDQLPSVGAGNVLKDIIESNVFPVIRLQKIFRQAQSSDIVVNAHRINKGLDLSISKRPDRDFFLIEITEKEDIVNEIISLCSKRLSQYYKVNPTESIQVLTPMQKTDTGSLNLNLLLQNTLNKNTLALRRGATEYRLGDKVMQIRNNYDKEVFNGDLGIIKNVNLDEKTINVLFDDRYIEYDVLDLDELTLAYATTIHKAQGSEYPIVIVPFTFSHYMMLQRNLLYTAITRAKKVVVIVGDRSAIDYAIKNNTVILRNTNLSDRLRLSLR